MSDALSFGGPLPAIDTALRGALVALLALLVVALWRDRRRTVAAQAAVALALGLGLATLGTAPAWASGMDPARLAPWVGLSMGNAVLFALFARALFNDAARWRPWQAAAWLTVTGLGAARCAGQWTAGATPPGVGVAGLSAALDLVPLVCTAWVVGEAIAHWRGDLVERRRRLRWFVSVAGGADMLLTMGVRGLSPHGRLPPVWSTVEVGLQLAVAAVLAIGLLRVRRTEWFPSVASALGPAPLSADGLALAHAPAPPAARVPAAEPEPVPVPVPAHAAGQAPGHASADTEAVRSGQARPAPHDDADRELATALERLMAEEQVYREEGLTVAGLAQRLSVPEYRLRRVIHQRLGHRHFNAYLNGLRLSDAQQALADPARRSLPVLTIALDAGFQSIGPFNRAFKAATGLTPTEFRQRALAET